jgi:hypothetical protein
MYPSEKVWKGVYSALHTRRRWYGIGAVLLLVSVVAVTWVMLNSPSPKQMAIQTIHSTPASPVIQQTVSTEHFLVSTIQHSNKQEVFNTVNTINRTKNITANTKAVAGNPASLITPTAVSAHNIQTRELLSSNNESFTEQSVTHTAETTEETITADKPDENEINTDNTNDNSSTEKTILQPASSNNTNSKKDIYPLSLENPSSTLAKTNSSKKMSWQIFFTPTVSYRKLSENKNLPSNNPSIATNTYSYASLYNVNNVVKHKPDMGVEFGLTAGYSALKNLKIIGGLQFNISRYGIRAYTTYGEIATVALNKGYGVDSIATWTNYRNFSGSNTNWLQNFYFSVSAPIGVEYKLFNKRKTQLGITTTLQPSYILGDRAYLISADYKNYVEIPWLIRRWNVNASVETFVAYSTGKVKWQVGPQVRYQLLSSFQNKYPVKENLFDFGLKVGIMLNK